MSNELQVDHYTPGKTIYARICRGTDGQIWNGNSWESAIVANVTAYAVPMTELDLTSGGTGLYRGDLPVGIKTAVGFYNVGYFLQSGAIPSFSIDPLISQQVIDWNGANDSAISTLFLVLPESYAPPGAGFNLPQALYQIAQNLVEFSISGVVMTIRKRDRLNTAETYALDNPNNPTGRTRTG
jgi:hypothetical protein